MPPRTLVLSLSPISRIAKDFRTAGVDIEGAIVVPLLSTGEVLETGSGASVYHASSVVARTRFPELAQVVSREWAQWCDEEPGNSWREMLSYGYHITRTPILHWRMTVENALDFAKPDVVYLYGATDSFSSITSRDELLQWSLGSVVREAAPGCQWVPASSAYAAGDAGGVRIDRVMDAVGSALAKSRAVGRRLWLIADRICPLRGRSRLRREPRVVVLAQPAKTVRLVDYLRGKRIPYSLVHVHEIVGHANGPIWRLAYPLNPWNTNMEVDIVFRNFMDALVTDLRADEAELADFVGLPWQILMSDHEHDPRARYLAEKSIRAGKEVVLIPEGAQTLTDPFVRPYFNDWFCSCPGITRFAVDACEGELLETSMEAGRVVVTGYLGRTELTDSPIARMLQAVLDVALRRIKRGRPMALVNLDHVGVLGLSRAGQPDLDSELLSLECAIGVLVQNGWSVCVTSKMADRFPILRARYGGLPVWFLANVDWQAIAASADVVIQRDSSLGPEAVDLGIRVIVWNDSNLPLASRLWVQAHKRMAVVARSPLELAEALDETLMQVDSTSTKFKVEGAKKLLGLDDWFLSLPPWEPSASSAGS